MIKGDLIDEGTLHTAVNGQDAIISTLGPSGVFGYTSFSSYHAIFPTFYKLLLKVMREHGVRRILAMSTFSLYDPKDQSMVSRAAMVWLVWLLAMGAWREFVGMITDAPESVTKAGFVGEKGFKLTIGRKDMAAWLVEQIVTNPPQWIGQAPATSSA